MLANTSNPSYYIYLNLHSNNPKTFSIMQNGVVIKDAPVVQIDKGTFRVRKGGHKIAVQSQTQNVHAFVVCQPKHYYEHVTNHIMENAVLTDAYFPVHYHYNDGDFFSVNFHGKVIALDENHKFSGIWLANHKCYLSRLEVISYVLTKISIKETSDLVHPDLHNKFNLFLDTFLENESQILKHNTDLEFIDYEGGICDNLTDYLEGYFGGADLPNSYNYYDTIYNCVLYLCFESWPYFSGDPLFPVSVEGSALSPSKQYNQCSKWSGEQGKLRFDLLRHIKDTINK